MGTAPLQYVIYAILLTGLTSPGFTQVVTSEKLLSGHTGDEYMISVKTPRGFDPRKSYHTVYFTDASLNSGKFILALDSASTGNCILVGIAHIGSYVMRRQRDFIPSDAGGYHDGEFGQAGKFYLFLRNELLPAIDKRFVSQKSRVFIGHSFGGLLALYLSLRDNRLFDEYYAISPSVWANHGELMKIEKEYNGKSRAYQADLHLYAGSLEVFNKVLNSATAFYDTVKKRNYEGLSISFEKIAWANHYTIIGKLVPRIFARFR